MKIHSSWLELLNPAFQKDSFQNLREQLLKERAKGIVHYPPGSQIFNAFNTTPLNDVKVVIIGQDPYHGPGQAHGLSFSVPKGVKPPPSLVNIFKAITMDLGIPAPNHGDLTPWADQGVLLLNAMLTVRANEASSHKDIGWQRFTDYVIEKLSRHRDNIVFMLWGRFAQQKEGLIQGDHLILKSVHPSPLSAHRGFLTNKHFSRCNDYLQKTNQGPINWSLES
ncbi:MAG: uracil-DNA glycosylase [Bacteroidota bacterium]|nr:uracil-DNA glycosylase [Bacteroidota bacterium]